MGHIYLFITVSIRRTSHVGYVNLVLDNKKYRVYIDAILYLNWQTFGEHCVLAMYNFY